MTPPIVYIILSNHSGYFGPIFAHIVMLIETKLNRNKQIKIWKVIFDVENEAKILAKKKRLIFVIEMLWLFT